MLCVRPAAESRGHTASLPPGKRHTDRTALLGPAASVRASGSNGSPHTALQRERCRCHCCSCPPLPPLLLLEAVLVCRSGTLRRHKAFPHEPVVPLPVAPEGVALVRQQVHDLLLLHRIRPVSLHYDDIELHPPEVDRLHTRRTRRVALCSLPLHMLSHTRVQAEQRLGNR